MACIIVIIIIIIIIIKTIRKGGGLGGASGSTNRFSDPCSRVLFSLCVASRPKVKMECDLLDCSFILVLLTDRLRAASVRIDSTWDGEEGGGGLIRGVL
jgi:hypothetical protein